VHLHGFRSEAAIFGPYSDEFEYDTLRLKRMPGFLRQVWNLAERIESSRPDLLYVFKPLAPSLWPALLVQRRRRVPMFLDIEDWEMAFYRDVPLLDRIRHALHLERPAGYGWTRVSESLVGRADEIFVVSRGLQRRFGGTVLVHGADPSTLDPDRYPRSAARARLGLDDCEYVVFTGSPALHKGLDDLIAALVKLRRRNLKLLLVGSTSKDGGIESRLRAQLGDAAVLVGPQPHSEMPWFLAVASAVVLPQRSTRVAQMQVPGKVFEAMAMARPIVATAVSDLPEILEGCGIVKPPDDPDQLTEGLGWILDHPTEARHLGLQARQRCRERYSWDAMERTLDARIESCRLRRATGVC
jgi:glycosyltransferase involved in cell wall biosynthesis